MTEASKIKALINLLDDPDENIFNTVRQQLLDEGAPAIPELEKAWDISQEYIVQTRIENIIRNIQFASIKNNFINWMLSEKKDLLEGVYYISKFQYPDLKLQDLTDKIDIIKKDVWLELNENLTALEKVKILNHIIFDIHKFSLNNANFYSPQNSYINLVIETKKGNPLSLSVIYMIIAQSLGLPVFGVNLPKNFILAYKEEISALFAFEEESEAILFYINPSNKGAVFGRKEIDYFLKQQKLQPEKSFYVPCSNEEILVRLINNLIASYEKSGNKDKISDLEEILTVLKSE